MSEIAKAYVHIIPSMQGAQATITKEMTGISTYAGEKSGKTLGSGLAGTLKKYLGGAAVAAAIGKTLVDSIKAGAEFEQLQGGVEKIFDTIDTSKIFADANNAYKNLNMSANEYLSTIIDVGANFASSMGDEKAYSVAQTGLQAISDYATGTGKDIKTLQQKFAMITRSTSSYQSIADQFAGILPATSKGFLEAAQAAGDLSGSYKNLSEVPVAEYQEAVAKALERGTEQLGLAGNTSKEALHTISGSLEATKSAWNNVLTAIGGGGDLKVALDGLFESIFGDGSGGGLFANLIPVITNAVPALIEAVGTMVSELISNLPSLLQSLIPAAVSAIASALNAIAGSLYGLIANLFKITFGVELPPWESIKESISNLWEKVKKGTANFFQQAYTVVTEKFSDVQNRIQTLWNNLKKNIGNFFQQTFIVTSEAFSSVREKISTLWNNIKKNTENFFQQTFTVAAESFATVKERITTLWNNIKSSVSSFFQQVFKVNPETLDSVKGKISSLWADVKSAVSSFFQQTFGINLPSIGDLVQRIKDWWSNVKASVGNLILSIPTPHFSVKGGWDLNPFDGNGISVPTISIDWYAKAAEQGALFSSPSIIGVGDARQPELLIGENTLYENIAKAVGQGRSININVYGAEGQDVNRLAEIVMDKLQMAVERKSAVFA